MAGGLTFDQERLVQLEATTTTQLKAIRGDIKALQSDVSLIDDMTRSAGNRLSSIETRLRTLEIGLLIILGLVTGFIAVVALSTGGQVLAGL